MVGALALLPTSLRAVIFLLLPYAQLILSNGLFSRVFLKPLALADFRLIKDYFSVWSNFEKMIIPTGSAVAIAALIALWKISNRKFYLDLISVGLIWIVFFTLPSIPLHKNEFRASAPYEHLKLNGYLNVLHVQPRIEIRHPSEKEIAEANQIIQYPSLQKLNIASEKRKYSRNLYVVLLESFADLTETGFVKANPAPFDRRFMQLWQEAHFSHVLPPVFGGKTAQSEFEVACGVAVNLVPGLAFTDYLSKDVRCLPRILAELGYHTGMTHGFEPEIFQSNLAYPRLGFQTVITRETYHVPSTTLVSDELIFNKPFETDFWNLKSPRALFTNTALTHTPYTQSDSDSKITVQITASDSEARVFATRAYEASRLFMNFVEKIQKADADALIVAYGDHLPPLPGFWSGIFKDEVTPSRFLKQYSTPVIMIDGTRGPVAIGDIPLYLLPYEILYRLGFSNLSTEHLKKVRPVDGSVLIKNDQWELKESSESLPMALKTRFFSVF